MSDNMTTNFDPFKEESLIQFRDCLFKIEDVETAMVLFVSGAKCLLDLSFMTLVIYTGRSNLFHVLELSAHSRRGVFQMNHHPLRIMEMVTRQWKTEFMVKALIGNHRTTLGYLVAGGFERKVLRVEDALIWENLVAIASIVFVNLIKPEANNYWYEKNTKGEKKKTPVQ